MARRRQPPPLDLSLARALPLASRENKSDLRGFRAPAAPDASVAALLDSLPDFLGAKSLRELAGRVARSHRAGAHVVLAMGGHIVKVGCGPIVVDLIERGVVSALCVNGAFAIHDYEIALQGATSEVVERTIRDGTFGWAAEPADAFAQACTRGAREGIGLGRALAEAAQKLPNAQHSMLAACARAGIPLTVHVGLGTDTVHMHAAFSGADAGEASHVDFRIAAAIATELEGGTWINVGSAVVMPEVFLKLVSIARNLGHVLEDVVAANLDMQRHYRTDANVIGRPVSRGIEILGHHEINLPLLRMAILGELAKPA
ncbi:MAG TPA: hypothetical protein VNF72_03090 [Myxococcota bacterium]|nr:hypothetical protein [Myxococcota bacterium]